MVRAGCLVGILRFPLSLVPGILLSRRVGLALSLLGVSLRGARGFASFASLGDLRAVRVDSCLLSGGGCGDGGERGLE